MATGTSDSVAERLLAAAQATSPWLATTADAQTWAPAVAGGSFDVLVAGGGIAGTTLALRLAREGVNVALVEAERIGGGVTGTTTAKVTSAHGQIYDSLRRRHGSDKTKVFGAAQEWALQWMRDLVTAEGIECDWRDRDAYTYTADLDRVNQIESEQEASAEAGLPATLVHEVPAPFDVAVAVRVSHQAEFHPRLYTLALARLAEQAGASVHEGTRVLNVDSGAPCVVHTDQGELRADRVVLATHYPILDRGLFFSRLEVKRSYAIGIRIKGEAPTGMLYGIDSPARSLRSHPLQGRELVIVGGEGHLTGDDPDTRRRYTALASSAREWFDVEAVEYRWSAQDPESIDELPYAGSLVPGKDRILVTTGYRKWGLTNATAAADVLHAQLGGDESRFAEAYSTTRADIVRGAPKLVHLGTRYAWRFARDRFGSPGPSDAEDLARGEATVTGPPTSRVASYRDDDGVLHQVSAVCTHLACEVRWNSAERSWDCPCHASRFDPDGNVLEGPATTPLEPAG